MSSFVEQFAPIDDGIDIDVLKNPHTPELLKLADDYKVKLEPLVPNCRIELGGSLSADVAVKGKNDIDLRILAPEGGDSIEQMRALSREISSVVPFRQERMIDGDQKSLKQGIVHRAIIQIDETGEVVSIAVLIRPERDYVGYGAYQRKLGKKERSAYIRAKAQAALDGHSEEYERLKFGFYLDSRRAVARSLGTLPKDCENIGNPDLPIWKKMPEVIEGLKRHNTVLITSPTGSGKTTQLPQALYAEGFADKGQIIVVQNRVVIAVETAKRVADEMGVSIGQEVGYLTRREKAISGKTKVLFCTSGILRAMLRDDPLLKKAAVVIFDEFDERELSMDFGALLTDKAQQDGAQVKSVIMSATLNAERLAEHYDDVALVEAEGRPYPVEAYYEQNDVYQRDMPQIAAKRAEEFHRSGKNGHILIFMPGKGEIDETAQALIGQNLQGVDILPLHSQLSPDERKKVFAPSGKRKIVISTNIAERGVTIDGVACVVNSGLVRQKQYKPESDTTCLPVIACAQDASKQRQGRAGRTQPGVCYHLFTEEDENRRNKETTPEIQRTPLREVVLQIKAMGYSREGSPLNFFDPPEKSNWKAAKNELRLLGALDPMDETRLSKKGLLFAELPCDPREGAMLLKAAELGCAKEIAAIIAIRSSRPLLYRPRGEEEKVRIAHARFHKSDQSDLITSLHIYQEAEKNKFGYQWCKENYVSFLALKEIHQNYQQFLRLLEQEKLQINKKPATEEQICLAINEGLPDRIWDYYNRGQYKRQNPETGEWETAQLARESGVGNPQHIAAGEVREIVGARGAFNLITDATVVNPESPILRWQNYEEATKRVEKLFLGQIDKTAYPRLSAILWKIDTMEAEVKKLQSREPQSVSEWNRGKVLKKAIIAHCVYHRADTLESIEVSLKDGHFGEMPSKENFVDKETEKRILVDYPDQIQHDDQNFPVEYQGGKAIVQLELSKLPHLNEPNQPNWEDIPWILLIDSDFKNKFPASYPISYRSNINGIVCTGNTFKDFLKNVEREVVKRLRDKKNVELQSSKTTDLKGLLTYLTENI